MKNDPRLRFLAPTLLGLVAAPQLAVAGGIQLYEIATPDVGLASAGYAARADDASTLFKNPAGMSRLTDSQAQGGLQLLYGDVKFTPDSQTSARLGNNDGGNAIGALPAGGFYYVQSLADKWKLGVGAFSYFGLMEHYDENWVGRYYVQDSTLVGLTLMPSVSFQATDWLAIGAGLNAMYGLFDTQLAVNNLEPGTGDGQMKLGDQSWGFGANVGVLIQACKSTRLGLTYLSPVDLGFKDNPQYANLGPGLGAILANPKQLDLGVTVPQSVMFGLYHTLNERWSIMADVGWQDWSQFGKVDVGVTSATSPSLTTDLHYQDTWHGALGAQYRANQKWTFSGGVAYDSSAVDNANRSVVLPMGITWRFGLGAQCQVSEKINLGAAYEFVWSGDMPVDQGSDDSLRGRVAGAFNDVNMNFVSLFMTWRF